MLLPCFIYGSVLADFSNLHSQKIIHYIVGTSPLGIESSLILMFFFMTN